ncbi:transcriptional regulator, TetR family [Lentzea fradiae]|uniref:Transcriptional regulator, TetR family n=1 Tax=Lentzea fradiae TaxID=200378 RepID=A0A1G7KFC4_9PSEU|nr:TetR/AcrR family transcriptional regulator [Lentzea fradiae]SDF35714.1 transcriptional regulator, TetR family [Lentzea fradiae]
MPRQRDERIDDSVLTAVSALMREVGYAGLTMEAIATRAGTTKPAVRRRWQTRQQLVLAAMARDQVGLVELDTGCLHCDLIGQLEALRIGMEDPAMYRVVPGLLADLVDDPVLRQDFLDTVWEPRRASCVIALRNAEQRGEIKFDDVDLVLDLFVAPVVFRALFRHAPSGPDLSERVALAVLAGIGNPGPYRCGQG